MQNYNQIETIIAVSNQVSEMTQLLERGVTLSSFNKTQLNDSINQSKQFLSVTDKIVRLEMMHVIEVKDVDENDFNNKVTTVKVDGQEYKMSIGDSSLVGFAINQSKNQYLDIADRIFYNTLIENLPSDVLYSSQNNADNDIENQSFPEVSQDGLATPPEDTAAGQSANKILDNLSQSNASVTQSSDLSQQQTITM